MMRPDLYVTAAALAALLTAVLLWTGLDNGIAWALAMLAGFGLRGAALVWNIKLPAYSRGA